MSDFSFSEFEKPQQTTQVVEPEKPSKKKINFQEIPSDAKEVLDQNKQQQQFVDKYMKEEAIPMPTEQSNTTSYLSLVLSPNLRDLELMIRGLEYVKRYNPLSKQDEIILRKIPDHPLNEYGVNRIMAELKVYCSPEIKLGRKKERDYYNSVQHVCHSIVRLIYKNLKNFGMDTQVKQRNAKPLCNAIIEFVDAAYSRSIGGKENDLSRATEFKIEGSVDNLNDPARLLQGIPKDRKEQLKN